MTTHREELKNIIGNIPDHLMGWLELSDDIKEEWRKGEGAKHGGHKGFVEVYTNKIESLLQQARKEGYKAGANSVKGTFEQAEIRGRIDAANHIMSNCTENIPHGDKGAYVTRITHLKVVEYRVELQNLLEEQTNGE